MADKSHIQVDWEERQFIEIVNMGILKITEFLNKFGKNHDTF